ncbi:hypothetical protein OOK36_53440 [Streptomyces sp. NBC_00365]|nr:hypothetical protein [Streptomyces sp. NBC_00365]MCX5097306.1 hypothetical protein [Streptomyces sp. NBC_00365]
METEVVVERVAGQLVAAGLDVELVAEEDVFPSPDKLFGQLVVDPDEEDVPEVVVGGTIEEQGR